MIASPVRLHSMLCLQRHAQCVEEHWEEGRGVNVAKLSWTCCASNIWNIDQVVFYNGSVSCWARGSWKEQQLQLSFILRPQSDTQQVSHHLNYVFQTPPSLMFLFEFLKQLFSWNQFSCHVFNYNTAPSQFSCVKPLWATCEREIRLSSGLVTVWKYLFYCYTTLKHSGWNPK